MKKTHLEAFIHIIESSLEELLQEAHKTVEVLEGRAEPPPPPPVEASGQGNRPPVASAGPHRHDRRGAAVGASIAAMGRSVPPQQQSSSGRLKGQGFLRRQ